MGLFLILNSPASAQTQCGNLFGLVLGPKHRVIGAQELINYVASKIPETKEFNYIRGLAEKMGVRVWLFGGTAASYVHYAKWDLEQKSGFRNLQNNRFDFDFSNIFRSTQDLDIVIDGTVDQVRAFQQQLIDKYPYFLGSRKAWEVRSLRYAMGTPGGFYKEALLEDRDFSDQNTDSNSIAMVELTNSQDPKVRDLRTWNEPNSLFLWDAVNNKISYLRNPKHFQTARAKLGENPEILSVIRFLVKAFQYDLTIDPKSYEVIRNIIEEFNPNAVTNGAAKKRLNDTAAKLVIHSNNIEYALNTLDKLGLREKLLRMNLRGDGTNDASYWLDKEPLRSFGPNDQPEYRSGSLKNYAFSPTGKTAADLGISIVAHETNNMLSFESIIRSHTGKPNIIISRKGFSGESAVYGDGFYTRIGRYGAAGSNITIRFKVDPFSREGIDFVIVGADHVIFLNKESLTVIPEMLNFGLMQLVDLLASEKLILEEADNGQLELFKRRLNSANILEELETLASSSKEDDQTQLAKVISVFLTNERLAYVVDMKNPKVVALLVKSYLALYRKGTSVFGSVAQFFVSNYSLCRDELRTMLFNLRLKQVVDLVESEKLIHEGFEKGRLELFRERLESSVVVGELETLAASSKKEDQTQLADVISSFLTREKLANIFFKDDPKIVALLVKSYLALNKRGIQVSGSIAQFFVSNYSLCPDELRAISRLENLPNLNSRNISLEPAFEYAIQNSYIEIADYLVKAFHLNRYLAGKIDVIFSKALSAPTPPPEGFIKILIEKMDSKFYQKGSIYQHYTNALFSMIRTGYFESAKALFEKAFESFPSDYSNPLIETIFFYFNRSFEQKGRDYIDYLLRMKIDINLKTDVRLSSRVSTTSTMSPLTLAIKGNNYELAKFILARGGNPNQSGVAEHCPLFFAIKSKSTEMVKLLLENGANPNIDLGQDGSALIRAIREKSLDIVNLLLKHGADTERKSLKYYDVFDRKKVENPEDWRYVIFDTIPKDIAIAVLQKANSLKAKLFLAKLRMQRRR